MKLRWPKFWLRWRPETLSFKLNQGILIFIEKKKKNSPLVHETNEQKSTKLQRRSHGNSLRYLRCLCFLVTHKESIQSETEGSSVGGVLWTPGHVCPFYSIQTAWLHCLVGYVWGPLQAEGTALHQSTKEKPSKDSHKFGLKTVSVGPF